jgi:hypothetical protein
LTERFSVAALGIGITPQIAAANKARQRDYFDNLGGIRSGRTPFTLLEPGQSAADALTPATLARLHEIRHRRDPHGVFRSNYPVLDMS